MKKKVLSLLLASAMVAGLTACGSSGNTSALDSTDTTDTSSSTTATDSESTSTDAETAGLTLAAQIEGMDYDEASSYIYEQNLGEFYELYMEAKEETENISLRYAKMAIAEAKLLETGVLIPNNTSGGSYAIGRVAPGSVTSVMWGDDQYRYANAIVTTELITAEDRTVMKEKLEELRGTGTYTEWAKNYLEEQGYTLKDSVNTNLYGTDPTTWDILSTAQTVNAYATVNTFSSLYQYDVEGTLQPELAESYELSDDGLTYTFHLREGLTWVDSQGRKVADLKADDFVAGMQHMMDCNDDSGLGDLLRDIIVNVNEYLDGEITDFTQVGVEAVDDYTLVYTLESPCPYFMTMLSYTPFAPMSRDYFTSQGGKFGVDFDSSASDYTYGQTPDNIAYCGPFLVTNYTSKNVIVFKQNESYWNKDNVQITSMTWPYEDQSDPTKLYNDVKSGTVDASALNTSEVETAKADGIFDEYAYISSTTGSTFSIYFNLNRTAYANVNDETKVVSSLEEEDKDRTNTALNNANFRLAVAFSVDKATRQAQRVGESLKLTRIRNSYTPGTFVSLSEEVTVDINGTETTFPEGTYYGEIVQAQLDADGVPIVAFDETADDGIGSSDGYDGYYNVDNAKEYLEKAIEELAEQGIVVDEENPIKLEIPYSSATEWVVNQANALKQSVESALDGKVEIVLAEATDSTDWYYAGYYTTYGYEANYNITDVSGWGPDYGDPSTYLDTFLPDYAGYVVRSLGIF